MSIAVKNTASITRLQHLKCCIIIPTYNNCNTIERVINGVLNFAEYSDIIIVNDGATDSTPILLEQYKNKVTIITNPINEGKGISLRRAFKKATELGFKNAITIDSDGQHYPTDIPLFIEAAEKHPSALIMGSRNMEQEGVPGKSSFGNKFSNFWFKIETGITLPDTQTGFRLYPLEPINKIKLFTKKFETEIEVIVKLAWRKTTIIPISINVLYDPNERVSHFRPFRDFTRISILNTYLVILTLLYYLPQRVLIKIRDEAIKTNESNLKKATAIGFGVFMGIVPLWGFQLLIGIPLAILFKLNKVLFITAAHVSVPPAIPFIIYFSYLFGSPFIDNNTHFTSLENLTLASIHINMMQYILGAILLALSASLISFLSALVMLKIVRKGK